MVKRKYDRFLIDQDTGTIEEDVIRQVALPELRQKLNIFTALDEVEKAQRKLYGSYKLSGRYNKIDKHEWESWIITLFNFIKEMTREKIEEWRGVVTDPDAPTKYVLHKELFHKMELMEQGKEYPIKISFALKNFVICYMHELALTNLLRRQENPLDDLKESYA